MKKFKYIPFIFLFLCTQSIFAQTSDPEMAGLFYKEGKIYVVIVVLSIVLLGIFAYLFSMQRKVKKLEKEIKERQK